MEFQNLIFCVDGFIIKQQNCMSENSNLVDWLHKMGLSKQLNSSDILSGIAVNSALAKIIANYTVRLSATNTAANRIANWNTLSNELDKLGVHVSQQDRSKILNGDDKIVYNILYELKNYYQRTRQEVQVDISKIDTRGDPKTAKSLLELFIMVIIKFYGFSVKEAVALLSNDSKYLAHILAKGFKENPHPVEAMISQLQRLLPQINVFCKNKENQTFFLKSIKPGLISKFLSISELSLELLTNFVKNLNEKYETVKGELLSTLVLCFRRHSQQAGPIMKSLTEILGYNKNLLVLLQANASFNEVALLMLTMLLQAEAEGQVGAIIQQYKIHEFITACAESLKDAELFASAGTFLIKVIEHHYLEFVSNGDCLNKLVENLANVNLSKRGDVIIYTNMLFSFLQQFGKKKNAIAPQLFKLAVERYRGNLNEDESHNYLINFLQTIDTFPSIPSNAIAEAILTRYENSTTYIGQLQFDLLFASFQSVDEKLALRIYNTITKIFVQEIGSLDSISNILDAIIRKFESKIIFDLTVKFVKVCLAVYYANLRKLNYSKSLVEGTVKLDKSNVFYKAKNNEIEVLLTNVILIADQKLNKALEPLVCYSFIQSEIKNKEQSSGIKQVMLLLGDELELRSIYETDAKLMLEDVKMEGRKRNDSEQKKQNSRYKQIDQKVRVSSDASLLMKKKDFLYSSSKNAKINLDAQKGLQKYSKVYLQKLAKVSLQQERKNQDEEKKDELRKRFTMKMIQKGINISKEMTVNCIYEFNMKQKQIERDCVNDFNYLPFYDPQNEEERDVRAIQYTLKKYGKLFKVLFSNYGGKQRPNTIKYFDELSERATLMQSANAWKLLKDHYLDEYITMKQVQYVVQQINAHLKKQNKDSSFLDFEVFENFIIQAAIIMFSRPPKDMRSHPISQVLEQMVKKFKEHAQENKIDEKLFEEESIQTNKQQELKDLNEKLLENSDYILPEGFKKHTTKKMVFDYKLYLQAFSEHYKDVIQLLDELLEREFGFHIIEPYSNTVILITARPLLYQTQKFDLPMEKERTLSSALPKESKAAKFDEIDEAENGNNSRISKLENKFLKQKKAKEDERRKRQEEEEKKREERDKQLKSLLEKHRQKQQEIEKEKEEALREEKKKAEEERKKKQKYQEELKKRVEEYMEKKRQEKNKIEDQQIKKREQDIKHFEKLKQDVEKKKKMVQEAKQKKKEEQKLKIDKEIQQQKKKEEQNKHKLLEKKQKTKKLLEQYKDRRSKQQDTKSKLKQTQQLPLENIHPKGSSAKNKPIQNKSNE